MDNVFTMGNTMTLSTTLTTTQKQRYHEDGYLVLENQVPTDIINEIRSEIERLETVAAKMTTSDDRIDLESSHTLSNPRMRRIKLPHLHIDPCRRLMRHDSILDPVKALIGPNLRLHTSKLNMKRAGYGAAVEWHQDWAFYPHTNDDILAVGVMIDDMTLDNGSLMVMPQSHRGPIFDHHDDGRFVGAINPDSLDQSQIKPIVAPAGSISLHHVRLVHGSDVNRSNNDRRFLLYEITAADAFPIMGAMSKFPSIEEYNQRMLCGEPTLEPRVRPAPIRIPQPVPTDFGSIYEVQSRSKNLAFDVV